jgi:hypothetical protein
VHYHENQEIHFMVIFLGITTKLVRHTKYVRKLKISNDIALIYPS